MPDNNKNDSAVAQLIAGIVTALLVGGTAPWWWQEFFSTKEPEPTVRIVPEPEPTVRIVPEPPLPEALDISGVWQGVIYQKLPNGTLAPYSYDLNLTQNGNSIVGNARLQAPPPSGYYVAMNIRGSISGNVLNLDDGQVIATQAPSGWVWCQKAMRLTYNQDSNMLQGTWSQAGCGSGQISLSR